MAGTEEQERRREIFAKLDTPEARARYEQALARWDERLRPLQEANRAAERITAEDLAIIVY